MGECPVEHIDVVISSFIDSQITFDNRKEAVLYFGRSEAKIPELLAAITNQTSIVSDVQSPYVPIAYPDLIQTNVVHYDFTPFVDIYVNDQPSLFLQCELINAMALKMIIKAVEKVTIMIVLPYALIDKKDYRMMANSWERVSELFGHQSMYHGNVNVILNNIPTDTTELVAHDTFMKVFDSMSYVWNQKFFQNDNAFQKTTNGLVKDFIKYNRRYPVFNVCYIYQPSNSIESIRAFIFRQMTMTSTSPNKFVALQSQKAKDYLSCLRSYAIKSVCEDYVTVSKKMQEFFQGEISKHIEISVIRKHITDWILTVKEIAILWQAVDNGRSAFVNLLNKMQIFFDDFQFTEVFLIASMKKYIFIQFANLLAKPSKGSNSSQKCITTSRDTIDFLEEWNEWINFLEAVNRIFMSSITERSDRAIAKLRTLDLDNLDQQEYVNLLTFLKDKGDYLHNIDKHSTDLVRKKMLLDSLQARLSNYNHHTCKDGKLTITGEIINVSIIKELLEKDEACKESLKEVEIHAMVAVEFSDNWKYHGIDQFTIIAPKWQVFGAIVIDIQGSSPLEHIAAKAMDGTVDGGHGTDGLAGQHGGHGAHFLGIAEDIQMYNSGSLKVITSGGKGTSGQDGGIGRHSRNSTSITYFIHETNVLLQLKYNYFVYFDKNINYSCKKPILLFNEICPEEENKNEYRVLCMNRSDCKNCRKTPDVIYPNRDTPGETDWWKYAQTLRLPGHLVATTGGNGGNGGVPGKGGKSGELVVMDFNLNVPKNIDKIAVDGISGQAGKGGQGGRGGKEHDKMLCYNKKEYARLRGDWLSDGHNGTDNTSMFGGKPEPIQKRFNPVPYIEKFKYELRKSVHVPFQIMNSLSVLKKLENSEVVEKYYTLADYITAFTNLEKQFFMPTYDPKVMEIYDIFYKKLNTIKPTPENSELLPFLKAALVTKILTMKKEHNDDIVIDFVNHFQMLIDTVIEQRAINEITVITKDQGALIRELEEKIREAEDLVRSQVSIVITGNVKEIEKEIKNFMVKIEDAQKKAEDADIEMQTLEKELEKTMTLNLLMNTLKTVSSLLSLLGPVGTVVGSVSNSLLEATSSAVKANSYTDLYKSSSQLITDISTAYNDLIQSKSEIIKNEVETVKSKLSSDEEAKELVSNIQKLNDKLYEEQRKRNKDVRKIKDIQDAQVDLIASKERELAKHNSTNVKMQGVLEHFGNAITIAETSISVYESYKADEEALHTIRQQIKDSNDNIQKIKETKKNVEKTVGVLLSTISNDMKNVEKQLKDQSKAALDVKRWNIQTRLHDLKMQLHKLTNMIDDKTIRDHVGHYVDKLEMTMNSMIIIYDRIDSFHDQLDLIDYIGDVNMAKSQLMYIPDARIRLLAEELLVTIKTNMIMWQYNIFIEQLKQATFPVSKEYLRTMNSMVTPEITSYDHNKIMAIYTNKIIEVNNKLQSLNIELDKEAKEFVNVEFTSDYVSSKPFFVWRRSKFRLSINRILRGESILLFADVRNSPLLLNAVKFNTVKLQFRVKSKQMTQKQLNTVLKQFQVSLIHTGESYYRCENDIYKIKTSPQDILYSYENNREDDEPVFYNHVYKCLRDSAPLLSPYTFWKIQLKTEIDNAFDQLREFRDIVDMELAGTGYHYKDKLICGSLEGHYADYKMKDDGSLSKFRIKKLLRMNMDDDAENIVEMHMEMQPTTNLNNRRTKRSVTYTPPVKDNLLKTVWKRSVDFIWGRNSTQGFIPDASSTASNFYNPIINYDFNSTLLLADVLCRKLTNQKPISCPMYENRAADEQATALILTDSIENIIAYFNRDDHTDLLFDPVQTQTTLLYLMRQGASSADINDYILNTIKQDIPTGCAYEMNEILQKEGLLL